MTNPYYAAKRYLRTYQESPSRYKKTHICNALKAAYDLRCISYSALQECRWHISQMLGEHYALESWVEANITKCEVDDIQEYRHRWLDHLAKEWDDAQISKKPV